MRLFSVRPVRPSIASCAAFLILTAVLHLTPAAASDPEAASSKNRRIARPAISADATALPRPAAYGTAAPHDPALFQVSAGLHRWLQNFGSPVICNMIFCHGSCADFDDSCPSFKRPLLEAMLDAERGCNMQSPASASAVSCSENSSASARLSLPGADDCCAGSTR